MTLNADASGSPDSVESREMSDSNSYPIQTARLELIAATLNHVRMELEAPERLATLLGATVPPDWPPGEYDASAMEFFRGRLEQGGPAVVGWYGWYAIRKADGERPATLVGSAGYLGPPDDQGQVEVGYSILPEWQAQGFATEITQALVAHAFAHPGVSMARAHTHADNHPSIRVLERCGFTLAGEGSEPGSLRFELPRSVTRRPLWYPEVLSSWP
jgi:RimJ/RimL family protein N-acetyltransferase